MASNTIEDLLFLFGISESKRRFNRFDEVKIIAENDWLNGKDAKDNPYPDGSVQAQVWYSKWLECNKAA